MEQKNKEVREAEIRVEIAKLDGHKCYAANQHVSDGHRSPRVVNV